MYQLRTPAPELAPFIEHYWFVTSTETSPVDLRVEVFVDARADLIFNFGAPYQRETIGGQREEIQRSNLEAQRLAPIRIEQRGLVRCTGVRFRVGGLAPFIKGSLRRFTDERPSLEEAFGPAGVTLEADLAARPDEDLETQTALLDAFFRERFRLPSSHQAFARALAACIDSSGGASVATMARAAGVTSRHVDRLFARYLGITPKMLGRIQRFQGALRALMRDPEGTLAAVASAAGYYDQAHFIKDFRLFSGGVPRGYRGYYPPQGPRDFAPNVVVFLQDDAPGRE